MQIPIYHDEANIHQPKKKQEKKTNKNTHSWLTSISVAVDAEAGAEVREEEEQGQRTEQQARAAKAGLPECWNWAAEGRSSIHSRASKGLGGWAEENAGAHVPKLFREKRSRKSERPKQRLAFSCY